MLATEGFRLQDPVRAIRVFAPPVLPGRGEGQYNNNIHVRLDRQ